MITIETVFLGAAIHGVALLLLLSFNGYQNRRANLILAGLVLLLTVAMWNVFAYRSSESNMPIIIDVYLWATPLLWAPFLYLYTGQLTKLRVITTRRLIYHSMPAIITAFVQIPLYLSRESELGQMMMGLSYKSVVLFIYPQIAVYFYLCFKDLKTYRGKAKQHLSAIEKINLIWLKLLVGLFTVILACDMALNIPAIFFGVLRPAFYDAVILAEAGTVFAIGYFSLRQPEILAGQSLENPTTSEEGAAKYLGSPVDEALGAELADNLDRLMDESELFLENGLTLKDLAKEAGLSPHHLSQVINQHRHKNFYDYINGYRAKYAAGYLRVHGKTNLTRLAFDCGFNNRVSFFQAFRKHTGDTPTNFLKRSTEKDELV
jgi:AraC-like DNA-binding protein